MRTMVFGLALLLMALAPIKVPPVGVVVEGGRYLSSHATARLRVTVDPQKTNRGLWTAIEATGYATAHYEQLEGAQSARTRWVEFADLPDGEYTAWARVLREHGEQSASAMFQVGAGDEPFP